MKNNDAGKHSCVKAQDRNVNSDAAGNGVWLATSSNPPVVTCELNAPEPVAFAAAELKSYLGRILNTKLPADHADSSRPRIHLSVRPDPELTDEGYEFRGEGATYHITGGGPAGVVFGAYEFLRRYCGCLFSDLGSDGEYVPCRDRIEAPAARLQRKPKLWYRGLQQFYYEDAELARQRIDWMAKNGFNYLLYAPGRETCLSSPTSGNDPHWGRIEERDNGSGYAYSKEWFDKELQPDIRQRGLKLDRNLHNLLDWLPPDKYFGQHPEWYALIDGQRVKTPNHQLCICTSNQEAVNTLIENIRKYLRENPEVKLVGVIIEDGYGMCQCEQCVVLDENRQDAFRKGNLEENRSKTRRYAKLLNAVARAIRDEFPDVLVGGAAYVDIVRPPRDVKLDPNTNVWVALYWRDGCRPIAPVRTSAKNIQFFDVLRQWKNVFPGRLTVFEYYMGMNAQVSLPYPQWEVICEDWKRLKSLGVEGATIHCWAGCHSLYVLNLLAFARCAWDDDVDPDKVLDDYLRGAYGSVADEVRPIFTNMIQTMHQLAEGKNDLLPNGGNVIFFLTGDNRVAIHQALQIACEKAADDRERRQVERLVAAVRYWEMAADIFDLRDQADKLQATDPKGALALLDKLLSQAWPEMEKYLQGSPLPQGWQSGSVLVRWRIGKIDAIEDMAEKLRAKANK